MVPTHLILQRRGCSSAVCRFLSSSLLSDVCVCASLASGCLNFFHIGTIYIETFYMILGLIGIYNKYTNQTFTHNNHKNIYFKKLVYI